MLIALGAVAIPHAWMDAVHRRLGLGALPDIPIVSYLSRSVSLLYAAHGVLILYLARDVRRYRDFLRFYALLGVACAPIMVLVDAASRLPTSWIVSEGPGIAALGGAVYWLATKVGRDSSH
jgi:hypothetical protein